MDNIIFLDIDGVLNCQEFYENEAEQITVPEGTGESEQYWLQSISPKRIKWMNALCAITGSKIVVSSSWRHGRTVEQLQFMFSQVGATFEVIDKTVDLEDAPRGTEIQVWITKHKGEFGKYVIIDDDTDMLPTQKLFQTNEFTGLTEDICTEILDYLNNEK